MTVSSLNAYDRQACLRLSPLSCLIFPPFPLPRPSRDRGLEFAHVYYFLLSCQWHQSRLGSIPRKQLVRESRQYLIGLVGTRVLAQSLTDWYPYRVEVGTILLQQSCTRKRLPIQASFTQDASTSWSATRSIKLCPIEVTVVVAIRCTNASKRSSHAASSPAKTA